jgi:hypothetical protein
MATMTGKPDGAGSGNFAALEKQLSGRKGVSNPAGLAAYIGRRKMGAKNFQKAAIAGKKMA